LSRTPEARNTTLPGGLRVALTPLPHLHTVSLALVVRVGARYESAKTNGLSHLCEHMLFRGTPRHPSAHAFNLALESLGGTLEASTHTDFTAYRIRLPEGAVPPALEVLAELFDGPLFLGLDVEKNVVREEILERLDEEGQLVDPDDLVHRAVFGEHPLGHPLAGTVENVQRFSLDDLRAWHAQHHGAANVVLGIAGPIDEAVLLPAIERSFRSVPTREKQVPAPFARADAGPRLTYVDSPGAQTDLRLALPTVGERDRLAPALELLSRVLDDGLSARVFRTMVEERGLVYDAFGGLDLYEDCGVLTLGAACRHESVPEVVSSLGELFRDLRDVSVQPEELARAKARALFELDAAIDAPDLMAELGASALLFEHGETLSSLRARTEAVTLENLAEAAAQTLVPDRLQAVAVGALSEKQEDDVRTIVDLCLTARAERG
jgi:predicted Zn-dependent peptidase